MDGERTVQDYELDDGGTCISCKEVSQDLELVQCGICKKKFHAVCTAASNDDKWATKSMITNYKAASTKKNFMFLCNYCLTTLEMNVADIDGQRMRKMERNMEIVSKELAEIKKLVSTNSSIPIRPVDINKEEIVQPIPTKIPAKSLPNIWQDTDRLATVKAKPAESLLVINKDTDAAKDKINAEVVENTVIGNGIPIKKSFKDKEGNLVVVCESAESRDELKNQVAAYDNGIEMKTPRELAPVVSLVGLSKNYDKEEVLELLVKQNHFLKQFSECNDVEEHIKVFAVKPLRSKPDVFQAFARISKVIRQGFKTFNDKVTLGLSTCKIYDQFHVKRCNNCQAFGHFYKNCNTPDIHACAKCGGEHSTQQCQALSTQCINCVKANREECEHRADDPNCPMLLKQQEKLKNNLNMQN